MKKIKAVLAAFLAVFNIFGAVCPAFAQEYEVSPEEIYGEDFADKLIPNPTPKPTNTYKSQAQTAVPKNQTQPPKNKASNPQKNVNINYDAVFEKGVLRIKSGANTLADIRFFKSQTAANTALVSNSSSQTANYTGKTFKFQVDGADVNLEADMTSEGVLIMVTSNAKNDLFMKADFSAPVNPELRLLDYKTDAINRQGSPFGMILPSQSAYFTAGNYNFRLSKAELLFPIGSFAYNTTFSYNSSFFQYTNGVYRLSVPLKSFSAEKLSFNLTMSNKPLINFASKEETQKLILLDGTETNAHYHMMSDGVYAYMPKTYSAAGGQNYDGSIYRRPAAWMLAFGLVGSPSDLFVLLNKRFAYSYAELFNERGFVTTPPVSNWLKADYNLDGDFYDTRFNTDTIMKLKDFEQMYPDASLKKVIKRYADFYLNFAKNHRFQTKGFNFVPDYADNNLSQNGIHSSLNHYLMEGAAMLELGDYFANSAYTDEGFRILTDLDSSASIWIKPDGDLYYAVDRLGNMIKDDYVSVTYNDLYYTLDMLRVKGKLNYFPGLRNLYKTKRDWLKKNNLTQYLKTDPVGV